MKTTMNVRTDVATKREAQKIFKRMGLDLSSGVNLYLTRIVQDKALPFTPRTVNGLTPEYEQHILQELEYAKKHAKGYTAAQIMKEFF
ncbi:MAG: type II toxin-antitoxin system RelB/DinJ family antitoxin [bacterium]|nr:type II toxin-antitoxin system RelB/DinJ family antitoxin [bacterium]